MGFVLLERRKFWITLKIKQENDVILLFSLLAFELKENQNGKNIGLLKTKLLVKTCFF